MTLRSTLVATAAALALGTTAAAATALPRTAASGGAPAAGGCSTTIGGNDAMRFSVSSITIPSSCTRFTIRLEHTGKLPVAAMGHSVVITSSADMAGVLSDGVAAGAGNDYVKPGDPRVVAHTALIGGGASTSVTFPVSKLGGDGSWVFFCSFPGHAAMMKGTIRVR